MAKRPPSMSASNLCPVCSLPHPPHHLILSRSPVHSSDVWHGWWPGCFLRAECQSGARNLLAFPVLQSKLQAHTEAHQGHPEGRCVQTNAAPQSIPPGLIRPRTRAGNTTCRAQDSYSTPGPNIKNSNTVTAEP